MSCAGVLHSVDIVNRSMVERRAVIQAMDNIERHGFCGGEEDRGLVHIVPEAGDAHVHEILVKTSPPITRAGKRKIRKDAVARPDFSNVHRAVRILDEDVLPDPRIVGNVAVAWIFFDMQVGDENRAHSLRAKIRNHLFEMRKILAIHGKGGVALLIVDVEINGIGGNLFITQRLDDLARPRFWVIAVAALLVAKRPERRKRRAANESGELLHDILRLWTGNEVIIQLAAVRSKRKIIARRFSEIKAAAVGVVEEEPIGCAFAQRSEKRNRL